jgi:multidrug efflux pump subunit AcrB
MPHAPRSPIAADAGPNRKGARAPPGPVALALPASHRWRPPLVTGKPDVPGFDSEFAQSNSAVEFAILKPWDERPPEQNASNIVASVRPKLLQIPGAIALSFDPPSIPGLGATRGFEFQIEDLTGRGSMALNEAAQALIAEARKQP